MFDWRCHVRAHCPDLIQTRSRTTIALDRLIEPPGDIARSRRTVPVLGRDSFDLHGPSQIATDALVLAVCIEVTTMCWTLWTGWQDTEFWLFNSPARRKNLIHKTIAINGYDWDLDTDRLYALNKLVWQKDTDRTMCLVCVVQFRRKRR